MLFPIGLKRGQSGSTTAKLVIVPKSTNCPGDHALVESHTAWNFPSEPLTFSSGKKLYTVESYHYGGADPGTADHLEKFYFTATYGLTRWERWQRATTSPFAEFTNGCNGPTSLNDYIRIDCRDWTNVLQIPELSDNPFSIDIPEPLRMGNLLSNPDFFDSSPARHWERIHGSTITHWTVDKNATTNLRFLQSTCVSPCAGNAIYQDVNIQSSVEGSNLSFGAKIWGNESGSAILALYQSDATGKILKEDRIPLSVDTKEQWFSGSTVRIPDAASLRFTLYLENPHKFYYLSETWLGAY